jgi:transketolase
VPPNRELNQDALEFSLIICSYYTNPVNFNHSVPECTHLCTAREDVGVMRIQPGLTVIAPADALQARSAILATWGLPGPVYYRLGKNDQVIVPGLDGRFECGRAQVIREGSDLLLIAMGGITSEVVAAAAHLASQGIACTVAVVSSINPAPTADLVELLARFPVTLTVEAHYMVGGLGSLVSEIVAEYGLGCRIVRYGVKDAPDGISGSQNYVQHRHGLSKESLVATVLHMMQVDSRQ